MTDDRPASVPHEAQAMPHEVTSTPTAPSTPPASDGKPDSGSAPTLPSHASDTTGSAPDEKAASGNEPKPAEPPGAKRAIGLDFETTLERVRLDQIDGVDEDLQDFLREQDVLTEVSINLDRWPPQLIRLEVQRLHLLLWRRRGRLVLLGSGRILTLARRMVKHDDYLAATIIQAKTLTLKQKLTFLSVEMLLEAALHRAPPGHAGASFSLWQRLVQAGIEPIKGKEPRHFALAMGLSPATVRQLSLSASRPE